MIRLRWVSFFILVALGGCAVFEEQDSGPSHDVDVSRVSNPTPKDEPRSAAGNPASYVVLGQRYFVLKESKGFKQRGRASWYGNKFHGNRTSNGEVYDMYAMTAAHKTLPLPTYVKVTNLDNQRTIIVRVNDRGPFAKGRIIDLSYVAAKKLDIIKSGTAPVEIEVLDGSTGPLAQGLGTVMLQVAAFSSRASAKQVAQNIADRLNLSVTINEVRRSGKSLYRVRLGPYKKQSEVERLQQRLSTIGYRDSKAVPVN